MERIDAKLDAALRSPDPEIGDEGFSENVMSRLPAQRFTRATARRWTLAGAAAAGSLLTSVLGAPIETVFSSFVLGGEYGAAALAVLLVASVLAIPVAWVLYSK